MHDRLKPSKVLFLSSVTWDFVWQRHQTLAELWSKEADVDFVELPGLRGLNWRDAGRLVKRLWRLAWGGPRRKIACNNPTGSLRLFKPWVLPPTNWLFCTINSWSVALYFGINPTLGKHYDLVLAYPPTRSVLQWLARSSYGKLVYDCTDDFTEVVNVARDLVETERLLLGMADLTIVSSRVLTEKKRPYARALVLVPHGVLFERFACVSLERKKRKTELTLLYYGHLHRQHLDFEALEGLARENPGWRLILVGPVKSMHRWPTNVSLRGQVEHGQLHKVIEEADVLLLPYTLNEYTKAVMPAKSYECLATGLPIVSTPLPMLVEHFSGIIWFVSPSESWADCIKRAIAEDNQGAAQKRISLASENSWQRRFLEIKERVSGINNERPSR